MTEDNIIHNLKEISANINDSILIKVQDNSFWTIIDHSWPDFGPKYKTLT